MIDYRYLRAFQAAARHLNFSRAAQELRISVSALSRQIALLEESSGGELFIRNTRRVVLTPVGQKLFASSQRFEGELNALSADIPLRIGCLQSVFEFFLSDLMQRHPKIFDGSLDIVIGTPRDLQEKALAGDLDLLITNIKPSSTSHLSGFRLFQESLNWIGSRSRKRVIVFSAFEEAYPDEEACGHDRIRVNSFNATVEMARRGLGRALVPIPVQGSPSGVNHRTQWIYAVVPHYRNMPGRLKNLVVLLKREAR